PISRVFVTLSAANALASLLLWRFLFHRLIQKSSLASNLRQRVLFVGWDEQSEKLNRDFDADQVRPYAVVGCVNTANAPFANEPDVPVLGPFDALAEILREQEIDMVILTDMSCVKGEIVGLANLCEKEMVQFKVIPSYFQIL